jgi:hypothetical protein
MTDLHKLGCDAPISIEDEDDRRYDSEEDARRFPAGHRRTLGQQGSGV